MLSDFMIFVIIYGWVVSAVMAGVLAQHKGRSASNWVLYSVLMGVGAFFLLWSLPNHSPQEVKANRVEDKGEVSPVGEQEATQGSESDKVLLLALPFLLVVLGLVVFAMIDW